MRLLIIDFETTGLEFGQDEIIEWGQILYDVEQDVILQQYSGLREPAKAEIVEEVEKVTGLTPARVDGQSLEMELILKMAEEADWLVAHNAAFEIKMAQHHAKFYNEMAEGEKFQALFAPKNWLCSQRHIDWRAVYPGNTSTKLSYLGVDAGYFNMMPHRALYDAAITLQLIRGHIEELVTEGTRSLYRFKAYNAPYDNKEKIKEAGYRSAWTEEQGKKKFAYWWKDVPDVEEMPANELKFLSEHIYPDEQTCRKNLKVQQADHWFELEET